MGQESQVMAEFLAPVRTSGKVPIAYILHRQGFVYLQMVGIVNRMYPLCLKDGIKKSKKLHP